MNTKRQLEEYIDSDEELYGGPIDNSKKVKFDEKEMLLLKLKKTNEEYMQMLGILNKIIDYSKLMVIPLEEYKNLYPLISNSTNIGEIHNDYVIIKKY
jgi:hypothetical protein